MNHPCDRFAIRRGFSLIELTLVIAIAGILAAIAAPRYGDAMNRYRLDTAARRIASDLSLTQSRARSMSVTRSISFNLPSQSYSLAGERDLNSSVGAYTVVLSSSPYYVSIGTANFGGSGTLAFNGYGIPSSAGSIQISSGTNSRIISVGPDTGAVSIR